MIMNLSRTAIKIEIEHSNKAIATLQRQIKKCENGILVNKIVLKAFEDALICNS